MYVGNIKNIPSVKVDAPGVVNAVKQTLIGPEHGWEGWVMRLFTLGTGGNTPKHSHPWPHINYVVCGEGTVLMDGKEQPLTAGSVAYIPGGAEHQFKNTGENELAFICIVPEEGDI
ncbi:cupin domain-containing protein [Desulfofalx alkaliphila]|uniref:cupin domain-containing protein n=1 Tax=Desulfofalx alkaliphila TaxID=105483 RepID=UPI0004E1EC09|nr:cupin domain-containing protein [Desulfofalx alkaliphila]